MQTHMHLDVLTLAEFSRSMVQLPPWSGVQRHQESSDM